MFSTIQPEILLDEQISMLRAKTVRLSSNGPSPTDNLATQARGGVGQRVKSFLLSRQNSAQELPNEAVEVCWRTNLAQDVIRFVLTKQCAPGF